MRKHYENKFRTNKNMKVISVVGARPNFMKVAPISKQLSAISYQKSVKHLICHTGQHYDEKMSKVFFALSSLREIIWN
jgi:UDP-N-acetylglucosamine 2-epimerase